MNTIASAVMALMAMMAMAITNISVADDELTHHEILPEVSVDGPPSVRMWVSRGNLSFDELFVGLGAPAPDFECSVGNCFLVATFSATGLRLEAMSTSSWRNDEYFDRPEEMSFVLRSVDGIPRYYQDWTELLRDVAVVRATAYRQIGESRTTDELYNIPPEFLETVLNGYVQCPTEVCDFFYERDSDRFMRLMAVTPSSHRIFIDGVSMW